MEKSLNSTYDIISPLIMKTGEDELTTTTTTTSDEQTATAVDDNNNTGKTEISSRKSSITKDDFKINIEEIQSKKLEFSLNKLPETSLIYVNNNIDYSSPFQTLEQQKQQTKVVEVMEGTPKLPHVAIVVEEEKSAIEETQQSTESPTQQDSSTDSIQKARCNQLNTSLTPNNISIEGNTNNAQQDLNLSDFKKVDTKLAYGRPPPSAPRKSDESRTSATSLLRQFEQLPIPAPPAINLSRGTSCSCSQRNYGGYDHEETALANNRIIQQTNPPTITRICIRSIDTDQNYELTTNQINYNAPQNENFNKKWNDYYDNIRINEQQSQQQAPSHPHQHLYRKRYETETDYQRYSNHQIAPECKNKSCTELRNKRIERVKQEDIICNHLTVERGVCSAATSTSPLTNYNVRDQGCQFPTPCARCINKKPKSVQNPSPLLEEAKYSETQTQTEQQCHDMETQVRFNFEQHQQRSAKLRDSTPLAASNKNDEYYQFSTPSFRDENGKVKEVVEKINKKQLIDMNIQTSSTPQNKCVATETSCENKTSQCPSPSMESKYQRKGTGIIKQHLLQVPPPPPPVSMSAKTNGLRRYPVIDENEVVVDFSDKHTPSYRKAMANHDNEEEMYEMKQLKQQPSAKAATPAHHVKFSGEPVQIETVPIVTVEAATPNNQIGGASSSKPMQTFYNGKYVWKTPTNFVVINEVDQETAENSKELKAPIETVIDTNEGTAVECVPLDEPLKKKSNNRGQRCCLYLMIVLVFLVSIGLLGYFLVYDIIKRELI